MRKADVRTSVTTDEAMSAFVPCTSKCCGHMGSLLESLVVYGKQTTDMNVPPWVGSLLLIEDIEGVRAGAEDGDAERDDETREDGLREVEGRWVDLHLVDYTMML